VPNKLQSSSPTLHFLVIIASTFLIESCFWGHSLPTPEQRAEKIATYIAEGGYAPERSHAIKSIHETWWHNGQALEVVVLSPAEQGIYPLIIYLPGLGEHAEGGKIWRETWAKAGYTVFSVQPIEIGDALKDIIPFPGKPGEKVPSERLEKVGGLFGHDKPEPQSEQAIRKSELRFLGHQYSSQVSLTKRIAQLYWAHNQFKQKANTKQDLFASADLSRSIIAGYDIGAQTTAAVIGEAGGMTGHSQGRDFSPLAAIVISPFVSLSLGNVTTRYQGITIPLLSVTSVEDNDPYAISTPTAFWENAPSGNKYLLLMKSAGHQLLAGSEGSPQQPFGDGDDLLSGPMPRPSGGMGGKQPPSGGSMAGGMPNGMFGPPPGVMPDGERDTKQIAAVSSLSTAFLDAFVKSDKFARLWMANSGNRWLKRMSAKLKVK